MANLKNTKRLNSILNKTVPNTNVLSAGSIKFPAANDRTFSAIKGLPEFQTEFKDEVTAKAKTMANYFPAKSKAPMTNAYFQANTNSFDKAKEQLGTNLWNNDHEIVKNFVKDSIKSNIKGNINQWDVSKPKNVQDLATVRTGDFYAKKLKEHVAKYKESKKNTHVTAFDSNGHSMPYSEFEKALSTAVAASPYDRSGLNRAGISIDPKDVKHQALPPLSPKQMKSRKETNFANRDDTAITISAANRHARNTRIAGVMASNQGIFSTVKNNGKTPSAQHEMNLLVERAAVEANQGGRSEPATYTHTNLATGEQVTISTKTLTGLSTSKRPKDIVQTGRDTEKYLKHIFKTNRAKYDQIFQTYKDSQQSSIEGSNFVKSELERDQIVEKAAGDALKELDSINAVKWSPENIRPEVDKKIKDPLAEKAATFNQEVKVAGGKLKGKKMVYTYGPIDDNRAVVTGGNVRTLVDHPKHKVASKVTRMIDPNKMFNKNGTVNIITDKDTTKAVFEETGGVTGNIDADKPVPGGFLADFDTTAYDQAVNDLKLLEKRKATKFAYKKHADVLAEQMKLWESKGKPNGKVKVEASKSIHYSGSDYDGSYKPSETYIYDDSADLDNLRKDAAKKVEEEKVKLLEAGRAVNRNTQAGKHWYEDMLPKIEFSTFTGKATTTAKDPITGLNVTAMPENKISVEELQKRSGTSADEHTGVRYKAKEEKKDSFAGIFEVRQILGVKDGKPILGPKSDDTPKPTPLDLDTAHKEIKTEDYIKHVDLQFPAVAKAGTLEERRAEFEKGKRWRAIGKTGDLLKDMKSNKKLEAQVMEAAKKEGFDVEHLNLNDARFQAFIDMAKKEYREDKPVTGIVHPSTTLPANSFTFWQQGEMRSSSEYDEPLTGYGSSAPRQFVKKHSNRRKNK